MRRDPQQFMFNTSKQEEAASMTMNCKYITFIQNYKLYNQHIICINCIICINWTEKLNTEGKFLLSAKLWQAWWDWPSLPLSKGALEELDAAGWETGLSSSFSFSSTTFSFNVEYTTEKIFNLRGKHSARVMRIKIKNNLIHIFTKFQLSTTYRFFWEFYFKV